MRNQIQIFFLLCLTGIGLSNCGTTKNGESKGLLTAYRNETHGNLYNAEAVVLGGYDISTEEQLDALMNKLDANEAGFEKPAVDFSESSLIFYFDQIRGTSGHVVSIGSIFEYDTHVMVTLVLEHPEGPAAEVITQPYVYVEIFKTSKEIRYTVLEN